MANPIQIVAGVNMHHAINGIMNIGRLDTRKVFMKMKKPLYADQKDHKQKQMGPTRKWAPLAKTTKERRARMGVLRNRKLLGRLPGATRNRVSKTALTILSRVRWSMAHQSGPTRVGRGAVLPMRQYYWVSQKMHDTARRMFVIAMIRNFLGLPI